MAQSSKTQQSTDPTIDRILAGNPKHANALRRGGAIKASELSLADQQALGINPNQSFRLRKDILDRVLKAEGSPTLTNEAGVPIDRVTGQPSTLNRPMLQPIRSLRDVVSPQRSLQQQTGVADIQALVQALQEQLGVNAPTSAPQVVSQSTPTGISPTEALMQRIINQIGSPVRSAIDALNPAREVAVTGDGMEMSVLQRLFNPEARKRTIQDLQRGATQALGLARPTIEQEAIKTLSKQQPELAKRTDKKGLKKFTGSGEFKVGASTYQVDDAGRLIKVR